MNMSNALISAIEHYRAGDLAEADKICRKILSRQPKEFDALHLLGVISLAHGELDFAINYFEKAVKLKGTNPHAYFNLGNVYAKKEDLDQAILCYEKAIRLNPQFADAYHNLAFALQKKSSFDAAIENYKTALKLNPELIDAYYNIGTILQDRKQLDEAEAYYKMALRHDPTYVDSYYNLGSIYRDKEQFDAAIECYQRALQLNPDLYDANLNLGTLLRKKGDLDNAVTYYEKALQLNSDNADAFCNMGNVLHEKRRLDEAIPYYKKAMELNPEHIDAHWGFALTLLLQGDFPQGLKEFEWRLKIHQLILKRHAYSEPIWEGLDISGKRILLISEQGIGDTIQFIRYIPFVAQRGAKIVLQCHKELTSLIRGMDNIETVISHDEHINGFDTYCYLLSLPYIFHTVPETIPARIPYITPEPVLKDKWKDRLSLNNGKMKVGLVWSGNPRHLRDRFRSCSPVLFSALSQLDGLILYSLQKGEAAVELKQYGDVNIVDYTDELYDFSATAALIENLDLVISVDTAVAHLAGAMGKRVWTLLPFVPDWRWMLDREDSPWYPTMRLFRQPSMGDWASVIAKVKDELLKLLGGN